MKLGGESVPFSGRNLPIGGLRVPVAKIILKCVPTSRFKYGCNFPHLSGVFLIGVEQEQDGSRSS